MRTHTAMSIAGRPIGNGHPPLMVAELSANHDGSLERALAIVDAAAEAGCDELALLHCVSAYPAEPAEYNLRTLPDLTRRFSVVAGLSDHTRDNTTAIAAVALGATIVEKHFTLDRAGGGPDDDFSLEPAELAALCRDARTAWQALGEVSYERSPSEQGSMVFRRSLYFVADIASGETITEDHIRAIRPGYGAPPSERQAFLGRRARQAIARGTPASWELVE